MWLGVHCIVTNCFGRAAPLAAAGLQQHFRSLKPKQSRISGILEAVLVVPPQEWESDREEYREETSSLDRRKAGQQD